MELRVLNYFLTVAIEGSISKAARKLYISQPTLSTQLKALEVELNKVLFVRGSKQITLTEEGKILLRRALEINDLVTKTKNEIMNDVISGDLYIGGGESQSMRFVVESIRKFKKNYPQVQTHLYSGNALDTLEKLDNGLLDFAVIVNAPVDDRYEKLKLPFSNIMGLLMLKSSPLANQAGVKPGDLLDLPLMIGRNYASRNKVAQWLNYEFDDLTVVARFNLIFNAKLMVEAGIGYATSFEGLVSLDEEGPLCFRPFEPRLVEDVYFVWKRNQVFSPAAKKFLEVVKVALAQIK